MSDVNEKSPETNTEEPAEITPPEVFEEKVKRVLAKVRPFLNMDGGDIELVEIKGKKAFVKLHGACHGCPGAQMTLKMGVEQAMKDEIPDFDELVALGEAF
ncbi:NifU family protein [bacterium]|nr:NifU family protein [bacterium]